MATNADSKQHPEAKLYFDILLQWVNPLIRLANKRSLQPSDVWDCPPHETVEHQTKLFWKAWNHERNQAIEEDRKPSFLWSLFMAFGDRLITAGIMQCIFMLIQIGQPFLVGELVGFIQTGDGGIRRGVWLACLFGGMAFISSLLLARVFDQLRRLGDAVRAGVMMAVYEQSLRLTTSSRLTNTIGQTTNLIAIDVEKLNLAVQFLHFLWHGPVVCLAVMLILITEIGYQGALAGLAFLFVLVPTQNWLAGAIGVTRRGMMRHTDERVKLINELLQAIRVIKLYAWEGAIEERVRTVRNEETSWLFAYLNRAGQLRELMFIVQPVAAIIIFTTATYGADRPMTVVQIFRMLAFLNITRFPLNLLAQSLKSSNDAMVSIHRLGAFFTLATLSEQGREHAEVPMIKMTNATYTWEDAKPLVSKRHKGHEELPTVDLEANVPLKGFALTNLSFTTRRPNELIAVIGTVGSGKSSFMASILNEMNLFQGQADVQGTVSYCAQTPWIQNLSLKQNILFAVSDTSPEQEAAYERALTAAALASDIAILSHGDQTEIGERGINLSGGQKARVSLARAFFSAYRSQIYLLDDPFSAVDGNTGNHIFQQGVLQLLADKLRIIALNSHMHLLKQFDRILVLEDGKIILDGSLEELFVENAELMTRITGLHKPSAGSTDNLPAAAEAVSTSNVEPAVEHAIAKPMAVSKSASQAKDPKDCKDAPAAGPSTLKTENSSKLMKVENMDAGVGLMVAFLQYISASLVSLTRILSAPLYTTHALSLTPAAPTAPSSSPSTAASPSTPAATEDTLYTPIVYILGILTITGLMVVFTATQLFRIGVDLLIAKLAENWDNAQHYWENWYYICFGCLIASVIVRSGIVNVFAVRSSRVMHAQILRRVLAAPIPDFFDTHTIGTILNRFAKDMETVDVNIPEFILQMAINWFQVFSVFALCIWASPWFAILLLPLGGLFYKIYVYFAAASRDLKRLESVSRSPIYSSLSETLSGLETIRAYSDTSRFLVTHQLRMDANKKLLFHLWICMSWMTVRLELTTASVLLTVALVCVCLRENVSPIALGIALSFGLQLTALFQRCVQLVIEVVTYMTSTERVLEYMTIPQENDIMAKDAAPMDPHWPKEGSITLEDVWMQYRENPAVLRGLNVKIASGQRIGVCGRTGAGKVIIAPHTLSY